MYEVSWEIKQWRVLFVAKTFFKVGAKPCFIEGSTDKEKQAAFTQERERGGDKFVTSEIAFLLQYSSPI